jgi:predicted transcriptional regulator of viral defense system
MYGSKHRAHPARVTPITEVAAAHRASVQSDINAATELQSKLEEEAQALDRVANGQHALIHLRAGGDSLPAGKVMRCCC